MTEITWQEIYDWINKLDKTKTYYGVPRGGSVFAGLTGKAVMNPEEADIIIDDLIDSGRTLARYEKYNKPFIAFIDKRESNQNEWIVFPYEKREDGAETVEDNIVRLCQFYNIKEVTTVLEFIDHYENR